MIAHAPVRTCSECPSPVTSPDPRAKVCSPECRRARRSRQNRERERARRPPRKRVRCLNCPAEFEKTRRDQKYCSSWCGAEHRNRTRGDRPKDLGTGVCMNCEHVFVRKHPLQRYCTKRCQQEKIAQRARERYHESKGMDGWTLGSLIEDSDFEVFKRLWPALLAEEILECNELCEAPVPVRKVLAYVDEIRGRYDDPDRSVLSRCRKCDGCGDPFLPRRESSRYCSADCRIAYSTKDVHACAM